MIFKVTVTLRRYHYWIQV